MKKRLVAGWIYTKLMPFVLVAVFISACGGGATIPATPTPLPTLTNTSTPRPTSTTRPTATPMPTDTEVPPTPTPAPVGVAVTSDKYQVTVVKVRKLETVFLNNLYHWVANPGYAFLELGVKVENLQNGTAEVAWKNINIIDANDDYWYPGWVGAKAVESGVEISPTSIVFAPIENMSSRNEGEIAKETFVFDETVFLRLIYGVERTDPKTVVFFSFEDSPLIEVTLP